MPTVQHSVEGELRATTYTALWWAFVAICLMFCGKIGTGLVTYVVDPFECVADRGISDFPCRCLTGVFAIFIAGAMLYALITIMMRHDLAKTISECTCSTCADFRSKVVEREEARARPIRRAAASATRRTTLEH